MNETAKKMLGERIEQIIRAHGISRETLSAKAKIHPERLSRIISGMVDTTTGEVIAICNAIGCSSSVVLDGLAC